jgi:hypothetical protein
MDLRAIFEQSDQCLIIEDPLGAVLDDIHNGVTLSGPAAYLLGRLPVAPAGGGPDPAEVMLKRSLVAYRKTQAGDTAWIASRVASAVAARPAAAKDDVHWLGLVGSSTGLPLTFLESLLELVDSDALAGSASDVFAAMLAWVREAPLRLMDLVRPESLEGLFGDDYKELSSDEARALKALDLIEQIVPVWMSGAPLCKIEAIAAGKSTGLGFCPTARHFAMRVAPDLAFIGGLPARLLLARLVATAPEKEPFLPLTLATLGSVLREGCGSAEALAVRVEVGRSVSRVAARHQFEEALPYLGAAAPNETFEATLIRVRNAMMVTLFSDLSASPSGTLSPN